VAVVDSVAPEWVSVPEDWTFDCGSEVPECGAFPAEAEDLCSEVTWGCSDVASGDFSCSGLETIHRIHIATDACGNSVEHLQVISFQDTLPPILSTVPADTTIDCREAAPDWSPGAFVPVVNCPSDEAITVTWLGDNWLSNDCQDGIERSFRIEDGCGNATVHVQQIALIDSVPPTLVDPLPAPAYPCWESFLPCTDLFPLFFDACQTYSWTCQDVVLTGDCATNDCSVVQTFVVTDACGNAATFETVAEVGAYADAQPLLPTGFSPNQDGYNDTYRILGIGLDASEVACDWMEPNVFSVFNRWGNEVFRAADYRNTWEGTSSNGDALPNGTYFVVFEYRGQTLNTYVDLRR
jgi:gliding motility-associated-like protein